MHAGLFKSAEQKQSQARKFEGEALMFLKHAFIESSGPLKTLQVSPTFTESGHPKPLILVGSNGSGKTNFLSLIADALFEAAAVHYDDVLPQTGAGRSWFRVVGGRSLTLGASSGFTLLEFKEADQIFRFREKAGEISPELRARIPASFTDEFNWDVKGSVKEFKIDDDRSRSLFEKGVYSFFPSSRSEIPYWLNREAMPELELDTAPRFNKRLRNPIYIEKSLEKFKQWLLGLMIDTRIELDFVNVDGVMQAKVIGNSMHSVTALSAVKAANDIIKIILEDDNVRFSWLGRKDREKISVLKNNQRLLPSLDALSAGQAILLGIFGTLLRYGDNSSNTHGLDLSSINGICVIDEIDAHIHIDLQYEALPKLLKLFPNVQFIVSSHSPIFVLGMEREFGPGAVQVIEMPAGTPISAEAYTEFGNALNILAATKSFTERVISEAQRAGKPVIYVEGETDAPYLKRAAELLGKGAILERCDIEWIGGKDKNGQGFNTGKDAFKHAYAVFTANPNIINRPIMLFYDNDCNVPDEDTGLLSIRRIPINSGNKKIKAGIENLLSEECVQERFYQIKENVKENGDSTTVRKLQKMQMCDVICKEGTAEQFIEFSSALLIIENYLDRLG